MEKSNEFLQPLSYDEEGVLQIHHQITNAYSSGVIEQEYGENPYTGTPVDENKQE
jgi:hypothetical protein